MLVFKEFYLHFCYMAMAGLTKCDSIATHFHLQQKWKTSSCRSHVTQYHISCKMQSQKQFSVPWHRTHKHKGQYDNIRYIIRVLNYPFPTNMELVLFRFVHLFSFGNQKIGSQLETKTQQVFLDLKCEPRWHQWACYYSTGWKGRMEKETMLVFWIKTNICNNRTKARR